MGYIMRKVAKTILKKKLRLYNMRACNLAASKVAVLMSDKPEAYCTTQNFGGVSGGFKVVIGYDMYSHLNEMKPELELTREMMTPKFFDEVNLLFDGLVYHEVAHLMYTPIRIMRQRGEKIEDKLFKMVYFRMSNIYEDHIIEWNLKEAKEYTIRGFQYLLSRLRKTAPEEIKGRDVQVAMNYVFLTERVGVTVKHELTEDDVVFLDGWTKKMFAARKDMWRRADYYYEMTKELLERFPKPEDDVDIDNLIERLGKMGSIEEVLEKAKREAGAKGDRKIKKEGKYDDDELDDIKDLAELKKAEMEDAEKDDPLEHDNWLQATAHREREMVLPSNKHGIDFISQYVDKVLVSDLTDSIDSTRAILHEDIEYGKMGGYLHVRGVLERRARPFFTRSLPIEEVSTAVTIWADHSGSMCWNKAPLQTKGIFNLAMALEDLGIPYEIKAFTGDDYTFAMTYVVKRFDEDIYEAQGKMSMLDDNHVDDAAKRKNDYLFHGNFEEINLYRSSDSLRQREEVQKILFVFCDGGTTGQKDSLKRVVSTLEKEFLVIGLGIMTSSMPRYYSNTFTYHKKEDLYNIPRDLLTVLEEHLFEGGE